MFVGVIVNASMMIVTCQNDIRLHIVKKIASREGTEMILLVYEARAAHSRVRLINTSNLLV